MWYERYMRKVRDIVEMPWVLLSCGFWMVLACIRGQKIRYQQWQTRRLEAQTRPLEAERDRYQRMTRDLERRIAGEE
jgi:cell division protein FtsB